MLYGIGTQTLSELIDNGCVYVDKTHYVWQLAQADGSKYFFLSRPRRFGKSLFLSTLESYFLGKKNVFKGLSIDALETQWERHAVFKFDFNAEDYTVPTGLHSKINYHLAQWEAVYGSDPNEDTLSLRFEGVMRRAYEATGRGVVVLVDEYDKPILDVMYDKPELVAQHRQTLRAFYAKLKENDRHIKFVFITGITKFSHLSLFSGLNNLKDISMYDDYSAICGITEGEMHRYFDCSIRDLAQHEELTFDEACEELRRQYDGYRFSKRGEGIYNPYSLLCCFDRREFENYWYQSGTPTVLVEALKQCKFDIRGFQNVQATEDLLGSLDSISTTPIPLFYQAGYLTIKGYDKRRREYQLGFPNKEVELSFCRYLLRHYVYSAGCGNDFDILRFVDDVEAGNVDGFLRRLGALLSDVPYDIVLPDLEKYYQCIFFLLVKLLGFYVEAERHTSDGRVDMIIKTKEYVYIIELKRDHSADDALAQIEEMGYARGFDMDKRKLFKVGIEFSTSSRSVKNWKVVERV